MGGKRPSNVVEENFGYIYGRWFTSDKRDHCGREKNPEADKVNVEVCSSLESSSHIMRSFVL